MNELVQSGIKNADQMVPHLSRAIERGLPAREEAIYLAASIVGGCFIIGFTIGGKFSFLPSQTV